MHIVNGRHFGDTNGQFTCLANDGCTVVDYHIVSTELFPFFTYMNVEDSDRSEKKIVLITSLLRVNTTITLDEVQRSIKKLKLCKTHGKDGIPVENTLYYTCPDSYISYIFQQNI